MNKTTDNKNTEGHESDLTGNSPAVLISGKTAISKNATIKTFNKIISKFGSINDFNTDNKKELNFFIEIDTANILSLINALEKDNNLLVKEIKDLRTTGKTNSLRLIIQISVQVGSQ